MKIIVADDGKLSEIVAQGDDQQVEQMRKELKFSEKGMVYVKGVFERWAISSGGRIRMLKNILYLTKANNQNHIKNVIHDAKFYIPELVIC